MKVYSLAAGWNQLKNMLIEFGIPEVLDTFFVRPASLYIFSQWLGPIGFALGKIVADIIFYVGAIIGYEFSKLMQKTT